MNSFLVKYRWLLITASTAFILGAVITLGTAILVGAAALHLPGGAVGSGFSSGSFGAMQDKIYGFGTHITVGMIFGLLGFFFGAFLITLVL